MVAMSKEQDAEGRDSKRKPRNPTDPAFDPMKLIRNVGLGIAAGGAIGVVAGVTIGILLNAHMLNWVGAAGGSATGAKFAVVAAAAADKAAGAGQAAQQTPSQAAQAATKAAEAALKSAMEVAQHASDISKAADISHASAQAASLAAVATAEAAAQFDAAQRSGKVGLELGIIGRALGGLIASVGITFQGQYKAVTIKGRRAATGVVTGTGVETKSGLEAAVLGKAQLAGAVGTGSLAAEYPHVYEQFVATVEQKPEKEVALLAVLQSPERLPRTQQLVEVLTALQMPLHRGDTFLEMMNNKMATELTRDPTHEETAFNLLRSMRYFRMGRSPPKWVEF